MDTSVSELVGVNGDRPEHSNGTDGETRTLDDTVLRLHDSLGIESGLVLQENSMSPPNTDEMELMNGILSKSRVSNGDGVSLSGGEEDRVVNELDEFLSPSNISVPVMDSLNSAVLNHIHIKEELEDYGDTVDANVPDEGSELLQHGNGDTDLTASARQPVCAKAEPERDIGDSGSRGGLQQVGKLLYRCKYCGQKLHKISSLEKHEEAHRNGTIYRCRYCEYYAVERSRIASHECKHTGEKPFACHLCDFRSTSNCDLSKHFIVHSTDRPFPCKLCPFSAKCATNLQRHMRCHSDNRPFSCSMCDWKFKTKCALLNHSKLHSDLMGFFCDKCDYTCKTNNLLRQHAITHSEVRNYVCSEPGCLQRCKTKSDLVKHMSVHSTDLDFKCVLCDKLFKSRHSLVAHTRRHEKREFPCKLCGKVLLSKNSHRLHMLTLHLVGKTVECLICQHKFATRVNLQTHLKVHAADRPFRCPICVQGFKMVKHLFTHIGFFHGKDYVYLCDTCHRPFPRYMMMKFHIDRNHINEKDKKVRHEFVYNKNCCASYNTEEFERKIEEMLKKPMADDVAAEPNCYLEEVKPDLEMNCVVDNYRHESLTPNDGCNVLDNIVVTETTSQLCGTNDGGDGQHSCDADSDREASANPKDPGRLDLIGLGNRSLTVKLERLDQSTVLSATSSCNLVDSQNNLPQQKCVKVVELGYYGNVTIKLAGRDSGVKFNMKKGKKCKGWFTHPDNLMPEAREKTIKYWVKQADSTAQRKKRATRKRNLKKRVRNSSNSDEPLHSVSKRLSRKIGKEKRKKTNSASTRDISRKDSDIPKVKRFKRSMSSLSADVLPDNTTTVKSEFSDNSYKGRRPHSSVQQDGHSPHFVSRTHTGLRDMDLHQNHNNTVANHIDDCAQKAVNRNIWKNVMPKVVECFSENLSETGRAEDTSCRVRGRRKGKGKRVTSLHKKNTQKLNVSKQPRKMLKISNSCHVKDVHCSALNPEAKFPELRVILPKVDENLASLEYETAKWLKGEEKSDILEVERVVDSPLEITWKKVGGYKNSRPYKGLAGSESNVGKATDLGLNVSSDHPATTANIIQKVESYPGLVNTFTGEGGAPRDKKMKESHVGVSTPVLPHHTQDQRLAKDAPLANHQQAIATANGEAASPSTTKSTKVRVVSLKEFEDEYKKRPKVVANVSLKKSSHVALSLKPVVQLTDIVHVKKRKGMAVNGNKGRKKRIIEISDLAMMQTPGEERNPGGNHTMEVEGGSQGAVERNDCGNENEHQSVTGVHGYRSTINMDVDGADGDEHDDSGNDRQLSLRDNSGSSVTFREFVAELKRNPERFSQQTFLTSGSFDSHKNGSKGRTRKGRRQSGGMHLVSQIDIALENEEEEEGVQVGGGSSFGEADWSMQAGTFGHGTVKTGDASNVGERKSLCHSQTLKAKGRKKYIKKNNEKLAGNLTVSKFQKDNSPRKLAGRKKKSSEKTEKSLNSTVNRKTPQKMRVSALLFGGVNCVGKEKKPQILGKYPGKGDKNKAGSSDSNRLQPGPSSFGSGLLSNGNKLAKRGRGRGMVPLKLNPKKLSISTQKRKNKADCFNDSELGLAEEQNGEGQKGVVVGTSKRKAVGVGLSTGSNRLKLPGLVSTDETERRLTVECVSLLSRVVLRNIETKDTGLGGVGGTAVFGGVGSVNWNFQCGSSELAISTLHDAGDGHFIKEEMDSITDCIGEGNDWKKYEGGGHLSLALALYNNNNDINGNSGSVSRNKTGGVGGGGVSLWSPCPEDILKTEENRQCVDSDGDQLTNATTNTNATADTNTKTDTNIKVDIVTNTNTTAETDTKADTNAITNTTSDTATKADTSIITNTTADTNCNTITNTTADTDTITNTTADTDSIADTDTVTNITADSSTKVDTTTITNTIADTGTITNTTADTDATADTSTITNITAETNTITNTTADTDTKADANTITTDTHTKTDTNAITNTIADTNSIPNTTADTDTINTTDDTDTINNTAADTDTINTTADTDTINNTTADTDNINNTKADTDVITNITFKSEIDTITDTDTEVDTGMSSDIHVMNKDYLPIDIPTPPPATHLDATEQTEHHRNANLIPVQAEVHVCIPPCVQRTAGVDTVKEGLAPQSGPWEVPEESTSREGLGQLRVNRKLSVMMAAAGLVSAVDNQDVKVEMFDG